MALRTGIRPCIRLLLLQAFLTALSFEGEARGDVVGFRRRHSLRHSARWGRERDGRTNISILKHSPYVVPLRYVPDSASYKSFQYRNMAETASLHGTLLAAGYYYVDVWLGAPPQAFSLLVDTASALTFVPSASCAGSCGQHTNARYSPEASRTHEDVPCASAQCLSRKCDGQDLCTFRRRFLEDSTASGVLASDLLSFSSQAPSPSRIIFGAARQETGQLFSQQADGVLGLGRGPRSVVHQLAANGQDLSGLEFALCYGSGRTQGANGTSPGGGALVLGAGALSLLPSNQASFTPFCSSSQRMGQFEVTVESILVAGKDISLDSQLQISKYRAVVDSGTTFALLPADVFGPFQRAVLDSTQGMSPVTYNSPDYHGLCFLHSEKALGIARAFPTVDFTFAGGAKYRLGIENFVFGHPVHADVSCVGVYPTSDTRVGLILGAMFWQDTLLAFDLKAERLGFAKVDCSQLTSVPVYPAHVPANRDDLPAPPPNPLLPLSGVENFNSTAEGHEADMDMALSLAAAELGEAHGEDSDGGADEVAGDGPGEDAFVLSEADGGDDGFRMKSVRTVDPSGCGNCAAYIDITLSFYSLPLDIVNQTPGFFTNLSNWVFLPPLLEANLSLLQGQLRLLAVSQDPGTSPAVDVKLRIVPYGYLTFLASSITDRLTRDVFHFTLPPSYQSITGPFNVTNVFVAPALFGPPPSPAAPPAYGAWRPWVFAVLGALVLALLSLWIIKAWRDCNSGRAMTSYANVTSQAKKEASLPREGLPPLLVSKPAPPDTPVVALSTGANASLTSVCHSPKRSLQGRQV